MTHVAALLGILFAALLVLAPIPVSLVAIGAACSLALVFYSPLLGLLFWLVSTPVLSFWIELQLGAGIPDLTYDRGFVAALLVVVLVRQRLGLESPFRMGPTEIAMAVFLLLAGVSLVKSDDLPRDLQLLLDAYAVPFLLYVLSRNLFTPARASGLPVAMAALSVLLVGLGSIQMAIGHIPILPDGGSRLHATRMTSAFLNAAEFGGVVAMSGCLCVGAAACTERLARRWLLLAAAAVSFLGAGLSLTRAVWVATVAGLAILAWHSATARRLIGWILISGAAAAFIAVPYLVDDPLMLFEDRAGEEAPVFNRLISIVTALRMWLTRPILGFGFGGHVYAEYSRDFLTPLGSIPAEWGAAVWVPHNEFLHTLVLTGVVGLGSYAVILGGALRVASACRRLEGHARWLGPALTAAVAIYAVNGMFADLMFFKFHAMLFYVVFGAAAALADRAAAALPAALGETPILEPSPAPH